MESVLFWICSAIVFCLIDLLTSNFFFVLFSLGAFVSAILAAANINFFVQIIVFTIIGIISLAIGYPFLKQKFTSKIKKTPRMEETYIGEVIVAKNDIHQSSEIKINGNYWKIINNGDIIRKGEKFKIVSIKGIKLEIRKVDEK
ncbi:NfeD family protein [Clostridium sp. BJN0001]|uniref:NfeD family protein n=1 Tax=Clostridium sp. BJN0001 TaxID=2930219 RepID=UPI001FD0FD8F|nr:NfeD family protein [Clostridium sp. BJN0001]